MTTTWKTYLDPSLAWDVAIDFPQAFALTGIQTGEIEIRDLDEVRRLSGAVELMDDEDGFGLEIEGTLYVLVEA